MRFSRFVRRIVLLAALPLLLLAIPAASVATANAATGTGWIRLAHLSPNTPAVDVYLYSFGNSSAQIVLHHVAYGDVSPYEQVPAGDYTVAMRAAGAVSTSAAVISASVDVAPGHAYTVAGLGPESGLRLQVLDDQLTTPPGQALVRIIQASLKQSVVSVTWGSDKLQSSLKFGAVSSYQTVSPGTATLTVSGGGDTATSSVPLAAGTVHTLVVLDGANGLQIDNLLDAAGSGTAPVGGAGTGFGGMAPRAPSSPLPWLAAIGAGLLLLAAAGGLRVRSRRATAPATAGRHQRVPAARS
jgi:Domain of unknown function (DUF4397)